MKFDGKSEEMRATILQHFRDNQGNIVNALFFDPRRAQILSMFDKLDGNGKNEAVEWMSKALAKQNSHD